MDKNSIKKYAVWARRELISRVSQKALQYGVSENDSGDYGADSVNGHVLTSSEKKQRQALINKIKRDGYGQAMEEAAYTWFNRFSALRFMEVNGYLPTHIRVFTDEQNAFKPQILAEAIHLELDGLDMEKVYELKDANKTDELYKYLLITQCNALGAILPGMFTRIEDYTELLFPDNLLREGSVIEQMISQIGEDDWKDAVQIIGWLYQYYNAEPKDKVFENLKKNIKISKENIPAATQLFTPDWIVRYMVENSLGRLWVEGHPNDELKANWKYYLEEAEQEPEVQAQLTEIRGEYAALKPEEIKVIDPCMGSGHILVYMFDVLVQIYESYGYNAREAAGLILQNNLYGLDIDDRAAQLAYFAVMMKARQYDRRIFSRGIQPHVYAIVESNGISRDVLDYFENGDADLKKAMETIVDELHDAKEYGSILNVTRVDFAALHARLEEIKDDISLYATAAQNELRPMIEVAEILAQKYHTVVTNPPYMGGSGMSAKLSDFVKKNYPDSKSDLFACFIEHGNSMTRKNGMNCMVTMQSWMFLSSFESMRTKLLTSRTITNLMHMENMVMGIAFGTAVTVFKNSALPKFKGTYNHITMADIEEEKPKEFPIRGNRFAQVCTENFSKIPGSPVAYWVSDNFISKFTGRLVQNTHYSGGRNKTHGNEQYTRMWWEIADMNRWQLYDKGGDFRRWYGNHDTVVDWSETAKASYASHGGLYNQNFAQKKGICWTLITSSKTGFRYKVPEAHYDSGAPTIFNSDFSLDLVLLGFLNSNIATEYLQLLNPTINMGNTYVLSLPYMEPGIYEKEIKQLVQKNIDLAHEDWDSFETSIDYGKHPLVRYKSNQNGIGESLRLWEKHTDDSFNSMKQSEMRLNSIWGEIYSLENEVCNDVPDKDISIRKADVKREIRSLISYAVGCMFGRYSLDCEGLAYAGGEWDDSKYVTFPVDKDNIIPICDDEYFDDDITGRFIKWVETVYGKDTLEENLKFIADALGGKGTPRDVIRGYFINDFYDDHLKIYQKRPIYWLFDSGKNNGFKALIYMHRYQPDTIARVRTDYVHEQQARYRTALENMEKRVSAAGTAEQVKLKKQLAKLTEQAEETRLYEEKIHHLADMMIPIDLDDGVKVNYAKFEDVLAKIK